MVPPRCDAEHFVDWGDIFGDAVLATAILDRLSHHSTTINIKGESCRLKTKRKAGVLNAAIKEEGSKAAAWGSHPHYGSISCRRRDFSPCR